MKILLYSVKDNLVGFGPIYTSQNPAIGARIFADAVADRSTVVGRNPGDFDLYQLGEFDTDTGEITSSVSFSARATDMLKRSVVDAEN